MRVSISKVKEADGYIYRIEATDHASGSSEVCNAVSGLMYGIIGYLVNRHDIDKSYKLDTDKRTPNAMAECRIKGEDEGIDAIWLFLAIAILQIQQSYPKALDASVYMDESPADKVSDV